MSSTENARAFESWYRALQDELLDADQIALLQEMVDDGQARSLVQAAQMLDWQESVNDPPEHMYGH